MATGREKILAAMKDMFDAMPSIEDMLADDGSFLPGKPDTQDERLRYEAYSKKFDLVYDLTIETMDNFKLSVSRAFVAWENAERRGQDSTEKYDDMVRVYEKAVKRRIPPPRKKG